MAGRARAGWLFRAAFGCFFMRAVERAGLAFLHRMDPERAHGLALRALRAGLGGGRGPVTSARLKVTLAGIELPNPIGTAAGYDKRAEAVAAVLDTSWAFSKTDPGQPRTQ